MVLNPNFFLPGTDHLLKVQARMEDKVRIKNLKSLLEFFEKFSRVLNLNRMRIEYRVKRLEVKEG